MRILPYSGRVAPWIATCLMLGAGFGCSAPDDVELSSECGEGEEVSYSGETYCVYQGPIIETRFQCPQDHGVRHDLGGDTVVCSKGGELPGGFEDHLEERGWMIDDPMTPNNSMNPIDPNRDPMDPNNDPEIPPPNTQTSSDFDGFWMFDATMLHARSKGYYVIEPSTFYQADAPESFRLLGRSIATSGIPRGCTVGGLWTQLDDDTLQVETSCDGIEVQLDFRPVEGLDDVYDVELTAIGLDEDEEDVSAKMSWRAIRCSIESGEPVCAIDLPRDADAVEPPIVEAPTEPYFSSTGYWDVEVPTGAVRIATYQFTDAESILEFTTMPDYEVGVDLFSTTDDPGATPIRCPASGASTTSANGRVLTITSDCTDGVQRDITLAIIGDFDFTQPDSYYAYTIETALVGAPPAGYEEREGWGGPFGARPCSLEPGPRQCYGFGQSTSIFYFSSACSNASEGFCESARHCESVRDAQNNFVSCEAIDCSTKGDAQSCFEMPHCKVLSGPSECTTDENGQMICTSDQVFQECVEIAACALEDANRNAGVCMDSGGTWNRDPFYEPGGCVCSLPQEVTRLYGYSRFSTDFGCQSPMEYCGALGGTWTIPSFTNETIRTDITRVDCVSDPAFPTIELVWNDVTGVCHRFDFDDPNPYCVLNGQREDDPQTVYESMNQAQWQSLCPMP